MGIVGGQDWAVGESSRVTAGGGDRGWAGIINIKGRGTHLETPPKVLTIKLSMPGSECVSQEGATVLHQATEGDLSIPDQLLLRLTGTAGVLLRTDLKVLTWAEETGRNSGQRDGLLGFSLHLPPVSGGWSFSSTCLAAYFFVCPFSPT